ncbi:MAG: 1-acyl-sn-glycerol-3-phosphate acyltransferase [Chloroflexi bacterium]|nr:MAG: 1-acyl-sn-glycerol-3-phosphate acyltransferase [Chloroflexota bacterium]
MMPQQSLSSAPSSPTPEEPALRYFVAQRLIGVPTLGRYLQTLLGIVLWIGGPPLLARWLARRVQRSWVHAVERWWARGLRRHLEIKLEIAGLEHIRAGERYVITPLHEGFADVIALLHLPLNLRFVARDELFDWRVLGPYLRDTDQICVSPENGARSYRHLLRAAQGVVAQGDSIIIFPQGAILGIETDFHLGAFSLARALGRPILPIVLTGSHRVWEHPYTSRLRYGQRLSMRILPPIKAVPQHSAELEQLRQRLRRQLKTAALSGTMAAPRRFIPERDGYWDGYAYRIDPDFPELAANIAMHREQFMELPPEQLRETPQPLGG